MVQLGLLVPSQPHPGRRRAWGSLRSGGIRSSGGGASGVTPFRLAPRSPGRTRPSCQGVVRSGSGWLYAPGAVVATTVCGGGGSASPPPLLVAMADAKRPLREEATSQRGERPSSVWGHTAVPNDSPLTPPLAGHLRILGAKEAVWHRRPGAAGVAAVVRML